MPIYIGRPLRLWCEFCDGGRKQPVPSEPDGTCGRCKGKGFIEANEPFVGQMGKLNLTLHAGTGNARAEVCYIATSRSYRADKPYPNHVEAPRGFPPNQQITWLVLKLDDNSGQKVLKGLDQQVIWKEGERKDGQ